VLDAIYLILLQFSVVVVEFGVYDGGSCFGGVKVKVVTDTAESTNLMIAGFR